VEGGKVRREVERRGRRKEGSGERCRTGRKGRTVVLLAVK